jgi:hypothetical protein
MRSLLLAFVVFGLCACPPTDTVPGDSGSSGVETAVRHHDAAPAPLPPTPSPAPAAPCVDSNGIHHLPDPVHTPGFLCSPTDPNFVGYRYPGNIAYCQRNIPAFEKDQVAQWYGIPKSDYSKYEFDHFIPLSAGGSDDIRNLWPQPLAEAHDKDRVEDQVYNGLKSGTMTQQQAVDLIHAWKPASCK